MLVRKSGETDQGGRRAGVAWMGCYEGEKTPLLRAAQRCESARYRPGFVDGCVLPSRVKETPHSVSSFDRHRLVGQQPGVGVMTRCEIF